MILSSGVLNINTVQGLSSDLRSMIIFIGMHEWSGRGGQFEGRWVARMAGVGLIVIWGWGCSGGLGV